MEPYDIFLIIAIVIIFIISINIISNKIAFINRAEKLNKSKNFNVERELEKNKGEVMLEYRRYVAQINGHGAI